MHTNTRSKQTGITYQTRIRRQHFIFVYWLLLTKQLVPKNHSFSFLLLSFCFDFLRWHFPWTVLCAYISCLWVWIATTGIKKGGWYLNDQVFFYVSAQSHGPSSSCHSFYFCFLIRSVPKKLFSFARSRCVCVPSCRNTKYQRLPKDGLCSCAKQLR